MRTRFPPKQSTRVKFIGWAVHKIREGRIHRQIARQTFIQNLSKYEYLYEKLARYLIYCYSIIKNVRFSPKDYQYSEKLGRFRPKTWKVKNACRTFSKIMILNLFLVKKNINSMIFVCGLIYIEINIFIWYYKPKKQILGYIRKY